MPQKSRNASLGCCWDERCSIRTRHSQNLRLVGVQQMQNSQPQIDDGSAFGISLRAGFLRNSLKEAYQCGHEIISLELSESIYTTYIAAAAFNHEEFNVFPWDIFLVILVGLKCLLSQPPWVQSGDIGPKHPAPEAKGARL